MKKMFLVTLMVASVLASAFGLSDLEKNLLPEFKGDLSTVSYKVVEDSGNRIVIEINGVLYVYKNK